MLSRSASLLSWSFTWLVIAFTRRAHVAIESDVRTCELATGGNSSIRRENESVVLPASIANAVPRPVTPFYPAVTKAIQDNAYGALKGDKTVDKALSDMSDAIKAAGAGS